MKVVFNHKLKQWFLSERWGMDCIELGEGWQWDDYEEGDEAEFTKRKYTKIK